MTLADFTPEEVDSGLAAACLALPKIVASLDLDLLVQGITS